MKLWPFFDELLGYTFFDRLWLKIVLFFLCRPLEKNMFIRIYQNNIHFYSFYTITLFIVFVLPSHRMNAKEIYYFARCHHRHHHQINKYMVGCFRSLGFFPITPPYSSRSPIPFINGVE